ncbi:hypothetical protein ACIQXV_03775 [Neobacillus sp. NPDC097160]|uniref:hypothetical protein n=1 Tax=Neobacillus sp. NPDC097160 TaxID=3364298 RepID=UPI003815408B
MADGVFKHLEKKGIVVPEHQIQPLMSKWQEYKLMTNNLNPEKLPSNNVNHKKGPKEPRIQ